MSAFTIEAVSSALAAASLGLTEGTNLFIGYMPDGRELNPADASFDACTAIYIYGGPPPGETMGASAPVIDRPSLQVKTRGVPNDFTGPRDRAQAIRAWITAEGDNAITGVMRIAANQGGLLALGKDDNDRHVFVVNFDVWTHGPIGA